MRRSLASIQEAQECKSELSHKIDSMKLRSRKKLPKRLQRYFLKTKLLNFDGQLTDLLVGFKKMYIEKYFLNIDLFDDIDESF